MSFTFFGWQTTHASNQRREVFTIDQLHREEDHTVSVADIEHPADSGMGNLPGDANFIQNPAGLLVRG
jgi:hypothetical protein